MAATKDILTPRQEGILFSFPVYRSVKIYAGTMVCVAAAHGYAIPAADAAGNIFVGIAAEQANNSSGSDGDVSVKVWRRGIFELPATSITQAMVGDPMYVVDDQTFDETDPGNGVICGRLMRRISNTRGFLDVDVAIPVALAAGGTLTITDAGGHFTTDTVEAALAQLASRAKKARITPIALTLEDGTALAKYAAATAPGWAQLSNKEVILKWAAHATPAKAAAVFTLPDDLDGSADVEVHVLAAMSGATDTPELTTEAYFNKGDTDCAGADDEVDGGVTLTEYVNVIAAADVPNGPAHLTVVMNPKDGELGTDDLYIYAIWLEYSRVITA